jgi:UDP-N-acetylglucosamine:LPS N-acetylglucosamine transferase
LVPDGELTAARLEAELDGVLADAERLAEMGRAGRRIARPGAADAVAALAEECSRA